MIGTGIMLAMIGMRYMRDKKKNKNRGGNKPNP